VHPSRRGSIMEDQEELIYAVAAQIYRDIENEDYTAIFELFERVDPKLLEAFLPDEKLMEVIG
jgi:hypothetical protein